MLDKTRLAKVLALTQSDKDHEALAAMRKANEIIKGEGLTWDELLHALPSRGVTVTVTRNHFTQDAPPASDNWVPPHLRDKVIIDLMFRTVMAQPRHDGEDIWTFLDSIFQRWETHGNLTQGQYRGLQNCYRRVVRS